MMLILGAALLAGAQVQTREVSSPDWAVKRTPRARPTTAKPRFEYKYVRSEKSSFKRTTPKRPTPTVKPGAKKPAAPTQSTVDIGLTIWKLRPPAAWESGYMFSVLGDDEKDALWVADRVDAGPGFRPSDKIRLAIESSIPGYLYVFDREMFSDGTFGPPSMTFPESPRDDNLVMPGMIADLPDQTEDYPYYKLEPKKPRYGGELLTIIVSPKPLTQFRFDADGNLLNLNELLELEYDAEAEVFSRQDSTDRLYSKAESKSACGVKTRQLEREKKAGKPCGSNAQNLAPDEPWPQTTYRAKTTPQGQAVFFVTLQSKP